MGRDEIDGVIAAQDALIAALDAADVGAIEDGTRALKLAIDRARAGGAVRALSDTRARVAHALKQSDAVRARVNYLADRTRQRASHLAARRGVPMPVTYTAAGRYTV